jgi:hypothetical protein
MNCFFTGWKRVPRVPGLPQQGATEELLGTLQATHPQINRTVSFNMVLNNIKGKPVTYSWLKCRIYSVIYFCAFFLALLNKVKIFPPRAGKKDEETEWGTLVSRWGK